MKRLYLLLLSAGFIAMPVNAEITAKQTDIMKQLMTRYAEKAKLEAKDPNARGGASKHANKPFSAEIGRELYLKRRTWQDSDFSCSNCHTEDPTKEGKHILTKKPIKPLAPSVNPERFTDIQKVERNFTEHCMDLYERDCLAYDKGNFISYMMSAK
jgi:cytochrome c peroxidase